jgi:hypothetical protein
MTKIVVTAKVQDVHSWEEKYRNSHDLFKAMGVTKPISFTTNPETNEVCICGEPNDLEHYLEMLQSAELQEAMKSNGVIEESVHLYILDKTITPE